MQAKNYGFQQIFFTDFSGRSAGSAARKLAQNLPPGFAGFRA